MKIYIKHLENMICSNIIFFMITNSKEFLIKALKLLYDKIDVESIITSEIIQRFAEVDISPYDSNGRLRTCKELIDIVNNRPYKPSNINLCNSDRTFREVLDSINSRF